ncbi:unnamed protein product [Rotaria magnacalcarata]|uniref:Uncharacterized protein n=1 Tax=Rotaria magnacalcarata TaxID=392030 RepID=A0A816WXU6_9BILA|nr:unnamed protein product [Rotaria magnacalcarata]CAF2140006.1 unnamed protein product [Rotaria magnacalcarata]
MHDTSYIQYYGDTYMKNLRKYRLRELLISSIHSCTTAIPSINTTTTLPSTIDNNTASASSQMRIVSQTNVNGVKRLVITNGNHFFSITTPTNTKTS